MPKQHNPNVLVGFENSDDAGVYLLTDELALVETVDFFTPIVDDPVTFGQIAAANALSDIYAMGGKPITALALACYPGSGDAEVLEQIMIGGQTKMSEAECTVIGGHSVSDDEIKFGYAVVGVVNPTKVWSNAKATEGDDLVLTKQLGTGVISTALKRGIAKESHVATMVDSMTQLNAQAGRIMGRYRVHAATDITGFGLAGHAREVALSSDVGFEIDHKRLEFFPGALEYARQQTFPSGQKNNRAFAESEMRVKPSVPDEIEELLYDPQTSGGLFISVWKEDTTALLEELHVANVRAEKIGCVVPSCSPRIRVF